MRILWGKSDGIDMHVFLFPDIVIGTVIVASEEVECCLGIFTGHDNSTAWVDVYQKSYTNRITTEVDEKFFASVIKGRSSLPSYMFLTCLNEGLKSYEDIL